jgi:DNA-binding transcriptional LysR family regulator
MKTSNHLLNPALRYFLEVARWGSISEASTRLNVATSAISRQISSLENSLGSPLFERRPRGMVLSAAGELLAAHARKMTLETNRVVNEIQALEGLHRGHVILTSTEGFAMEFLPQIIYQFRRKYQGIHFQLDVRTPHDVSQAIRNGDADIGLTFSLTPTEGILVNHRQPAPINAIVPVNHPLAGRQHITLAQLQPYPIALPYGDTTVRQLFDICCSHQQLVFEPALVSNYMAALNHFSAFGGGVSLSGEISVRNMANEDLLRILPVRDRGMNVRNIEVQTLMGRTLPKAVQTFLQFLIEKLPQPGAENAQV